MQNPLIFHQAYSITVSKALKPFLMEKQTNKQTIDVSKMKLSAHCVGVQVSLNEKKYLLNTQ